MFLALKSAGMGPRGASLLIAAATFALGFGVAAYRPLVSELKAGSAGQGAAVHMKPAVSHAGHPAEVLRIIDGDTFEARVHVWPGMEITTKVRLRGVDTPELHARCDDERTKALAARDALTRILDEGAVGIAEVGQDKYGGRVDAVVSTARTADVSAELLARGFARRYTGGRRSGWCG